MAIILDPDELQQSTQPSTGTPDGNIYINTATRTVEVIPNQGIFGTVELTEDGVTLQALYSFLKEEWKSDAALIPFPFPLTAITPEQFEFGENWKPVDDTTRKLVRTGGWREIDDTGTLNREYFGVITLGTIDNVSRLDGDYVYYFFDSDTSSTQFTYAGPVNEAVQTFGDADNGSFDKRTEVFTARIRVFGKTYDQSTTTAIGVTTITNKVERFPLSESIDAVVFDLFGAEPDPTVVIDGQAPYSDMSIAYFDTPQTRTGFTDVGGDGGSTTFGVIVDADISEATEDGNGAATAEQIYAFVQRQLIETTDINEGAGGAATAVIGQLAEPLLSLASTGNTMSTIEQTSNPGGDGTGVYVDSFASNDKNRIQFVDNDGDTRTFPFVAAGTINFNANLENDGAAEYWMFFDHTVRTTVADLAITPTTGAQADWTSAGNNLPTLSNGEHVRLAGASDEINNNIWEVVTFTSNGSATLSLYNGSTPANETAFSATVDENPIDSPSALLVDNNSGTDITGTITGASASFDFDYDGNTQGGRSSGTDASIVLRALGLNTAQFIEATGTITRATGLSYTLVAALERNYNNPV